MNITLGEAVLYLSCCFLLLGLLPCIIEKCYDCRYKNTERNKQENEDEHEDFICHFDDSLPPYSV